MRTGNKQVRKMKQRPRAMPVTYTYQLTTDGQVVVGGILTKEQLPGFSCKVRTGNRQVRKGARRWLPRGWRDGVNDVLPLNYPPIGRGSGS
jgi:hypothetical protein